MADVTVNTSDVLRHLAVRSSTKDSLLLAWKVSNGFAGYVQGYRVRYQAIGSAIVQDSPFLPSPTNFFDITHLHENTFYDVCLRVFTNVTLPADSCLTAATSTHSLSVALGSTFGAFLALGVVVMFVLLAKWQHYHRSRKLFQQQILTADSTESMDDDLCIVQENGDIELNCLELGQATVDPGQVKDGSSPILSEYSADVIFHGASVLTGDPSAGGAAPGGEGRVLFGLDGHSCANSFILTSPSRDSKTGVSYSLLVPLSASGVLPFLMQQQQQQDHDQGHRQGHGHRDDASLSTAATRSGTKVKHQHPVVRLKLRKHPTVDYSSAEEEWHSRAAHHHQPEVVSRLADQSRGQTMPYPLNGATAQLNQHPVNIDDPQDSIEGKPMAAPMITSALLGSPTGCDALPRSISNTW